MIPAIVSSVIFVITLLLIFSEKLDRTIAAVGGAAMMTLAGILLDFYHEDQAAQAIDMETIGLLLGMMLLVAMLEPTGFFEYLAILAARLAKGKPFVMLVLLGTTTILSMFLDNVTTVVLIAPVTILICNIIGVASTPYLITEALLSNTGGIATLVGDPPNVLIASAAGLSFDSFLTHALPIVVVLWLVALLMVRWLFHTELSVPPKHASALASINLRSELHDPKSARRLLVVLSFTVVGFFLQEWLKVSPAFIALTGAAVASIWLKVNLRTVFQRVEWNVLAFFTGLFVLVGGLEASGVLKTLAHFIAGFGKHDLLLLGISLLWFVAIISTVVDNIPITIAIIPVILDLGLDGVNIAPLWWALAFGAGLGGNGTIIGSTANVVVATISERTSDPITSKLWSKKGLPVMAVTLLVATILYILIFPYYLK